MHELIVVADFDVFVFVIELFVCFGDGVECEGVGDGAGEVDDPVVRYCADAADGVEQFHF